MTTTIHFLLCCLIILTGHLFTPLQAQVSGEKPLAICNCQLTFVYNTDCQLVVKAEDIDAGSYSPSGEDLTLKIFDYYRDPQEEILYEDPCYGGDLHLIHLIATSENGRSDTCLSVVEHQPGTCYDDLIESCHPCHTCYPVSGSFYTPTGTPINKVSLYLDGNPKGSFNQMFCMYNDRPSTYYEVSILEPQKEDDIQRGLSVLDLVLIRAAQFEKVELSHFQKIAGDITYDEKVSLRDAIELKQVLLNDWEEFSRSPDWRFIPANHEFGGDTWERPIPYYIELDYESRHENVDFIGVKMGDVSGDSWGRAHPRTASVFTVQTEDRQLEAGEEMTIDFASSAVKQTSGYQFTLEFDPDHLEFIDINGSIAQEDLNLDRVNEGMIGVVMLQDQDKEDLLFTLEFKTKRDLQLSENLSLNSTMIPALAYNHKFEEMDISLSFINEADSYSLHQNTPNPFSRQTTIGFQLAQPGEATLRIMDSQGKVLSERNGHYERGYNSETFTRSQLPVCGLYYYRLTAGDFTATKKLLVLE